MKKLLTNELHGLRHSRTSCKKLMFLFFVLLSVFGFAQTITIPAANTNTGGARYPLAHLWGYERSADIYTAAEHGMTAGSQVNQVCWFANSISTTATTTPLIISMKTTTAANFTAPSTVATELTGATTVYTGTIGTITANAWKCYTLTAPFSYTGDNIEVIVQTNYGGGGITGSPTLRYSTKATAHQQWTADTSPPTGVGVTNSSRPNLQLVYSSPAGPGKLQFSSVTYGGNEGTTATVTVTRTGGIDGAVSVDYATSDGTATAGSDYTAASGTLSWADGESDSKTFNVSLLTDGVIDANETVNLTLSNVTGGATIGANNPAVLTITDVPPALSGTYSVPGDYPSLTNAGGIFAAMNLSGVVGNVTINITDNLTGETGANTLNEFAAPYTVLIKPSGAARTITGSSTTALIKLSGADRVSIDGSTSATIGSGTATRELTVTNTAAGALVWIGTNNTSGANNNVIQNVSFVGAAGQGFIVGSGTTFGGAAENGRPNSNNTIRNCAMTKVQNAIFAVGDAVTLDENWLITENNFGSATLADKLTFRGIAIQNAKNFTITRNIITGIVASGGSSIAGILAGATLDGGLIDSNQIKDIRQTSATGYGAAGINLNSASATSNVVVSNNFISDLSGYGYNGFAVGDNGYGIMVNNGGGFTVVYNTIVMNANQTSAGGHSSAINIAATVPVGGLDLRNNIFVSTQTVGNRYAIIHQGTDATAFSHIDNNNYYGVAGVNIGRLNSVNRADLAAWKTATGQDVNSINVNPTFVSGTDFHLSSCTSGVNGMGTHIAGVTKDIDGNTRHGVTPDIGADEYVSAASATLLTSPADTATNVSVDPTLTWGAASGATGYKLYVGTTSGGTDVLNGTDVGNVTSYGLTSLASNTTHYVKVVAYNSCNVGTVGSETTFTTENTLAVSNNSKGNLSVYPNPFADVLKISDVKEVKSISITDMTGRQVKALKPSTELNLSSLNSGVYVVTLKMNDGSVKAFKVVKK